MFSVLVTEAWGASEAVQAQYLIERRLDLAASTEPVLQVRERATGQRLWLKCNDGTPLSPDRLAGELRILTRLTHPHLLSPLPRKAGDGELYLLYPWRAEEPLSGLELPQLAASDRLRVAAALVEVITYLHGLKPAVLHGAPALENLWLVGGVAWLRLAGFSHASDAATAPQLEAERRQVLALAWQVLEADGQGPPVEHQLAELGARWAAEPQQAYGEFESALQQAFLRRVTADL
jgi:hypothetical protein